MNFPPMTPEQQKAHQEWRASLDRDINRCRQAGRSFTAVTLPDGRHRECSSAEEAYFHGRGKGHMA